MTIKRRSALLALVTVPLLARADALAALRSGGVAVLLRHAQTDAGIGDPPEFRLGDCATQRNLSAAGREQSRCIGAWFAARRLQPARVRSSPWCRCVDTAQFAFGSVDEWQALGSTFSEPQRRDAQSAALRDALLGLPRRGFEVWVTHQVNVGGLAGAAVAMGHGIVVRGAGGVTVHNLGALHFENPHPSPLPRAGEGVTR